MQYQEVDDEKQTNYKPKVPKEEEHLTLQLHATSFQTSFLPSLVEAEQTRRNF